MGYSKPQPQPAKPSIKTSSGSSGNTENKENAGETKRKVTFVEVNPKNETTHTVPQGG